MAITNAETKIRGLIKEAHDMRRHHDDLYWNETITKDRRQFHAVKVHYYRGHALALEKALTAILEAFDNAEEA